MSDVTYYDYRHSAEPVAMAGLLKAFGTRVLCRAILENDWYHGPIQLIEYSALDVMAFEVVSVGAGVAMACEKMGEHPIEVGEIVDCRSVGADRVHSNDPTVRYWLVPVEDIAARNMPVDLDTPGFLEALAAYRARQERTSAPVISNGQADLSPQR